MAERSKPANSDILRHDIDSGRTGAKVAFGDPAAAPLGTDEEAAGAPPSGKEIEAARQQERFDHPSDFTRPRDRSGAVIGHGVVWLLLVVLLVGGVLAAQGLF